MKTFPLNRLALGMAAGAVLLAACGGGGGDAPPAGDPLLSSTNDVPTSATTSSAGAFTYVNGLAAAKPDNTDPQNVGENITLATSETDEPDPGV